MARYAIFLVAMCVLAPSASGQTDLPAIAVHVEKHMDRSCHDGMPSLDENSVKTTYDGVGKIDAFIVLMRYEEVKAVSFGVAWPETWDARGWQDCSDFRMGDIIHPGDATSLVWEDCIRDSVPLILGWLTFTVTTPGTIEIVPSHREGAVVVANCNEISTELADIMIALKGGAGGAKGDDISRLGEIRNRNWYVRPDSSGDSPTISSALRTALPGDTVFVSCGTYGESVILRPGVVVLGSWDRDFEKRSLIHTPSIIDASGFRTGVSAMFGEDSTTVFDGFVITGASGRFGGGIALTSRSSPVLSNLVIHSNTSAFGGGIACRASSPVIREVLIVRNTADSGGGIYCSEGSSPLISNVTLAENEASHGSAVFAISGSSPRVERSVIACHPRGHAVFADAGSMVSVLCCDLWSNLPSDFGGRAGNTAALRDNISDDPQFVDPSELDFTLKATSPALSIGGCGRIGPQYARGPEK